MKKLIERIRYKLPKTIVGVWYNRSVHGCGKYPIIFDNDKKYIHPRTGICVVMNELSDGRKVYYRITKIWRGCGGDWLYDTDACNCNLVYDHIEKK